MAKKKKSLDVGDEEQVQDNKDKMGLAREREVEEFKAILQTREGRAFVWRVLCRCGVYCTPVIHELETFVAIGKQDLGHWLIIEVFTSDPKAYTMMRQEAEERDNDG